MHVYPTSQLVPGHVSIMACSTVSKRVLHVGAMARQQLYVHTTCGGAATHHTHGRAPDPTVGCCQMMYYMLQQSSINTILWG